MKLVLMSEIVPGVMKLVLMSEIVPGVMRLAMEARLMPESSIASLRLADCP